MADPSETTPVSQEPTEGDAELVDAVRMLTAQVGSLSDDVHALRVETRALPSGETDRPGWDERGPIVREGAAWVGSVDSPRDRGIAIPWLLLEILFLVAVAVLCVVADLDAPAIAGVMIAAWLLVALAEWLASRADRQRHALVYGAGVPVAAGMPDDRSWFASNGDDTMLDAPSSERQPARLPPVE
jgi:hypothetical protein